MEPPAPDALRRFQDDLSLLGYAGDVATDLATRTIFATDNSIYEARPAAVLYPRDPEDLNRIVRAAATAGVAVVARGGGTGTNGQSLTESVVVDCSRHLNRILSLDPEAGTAVVEPGVILDQLNTEAAKHGMHFGPSVSTSSRATLGGMAATDAAGKGSRVFGRTSDHILSMDVVLSDGSDWRAQYLGLDALKAVCERDDLPGKIHRELWQILKDEAEEIGRVFPVMNRGLTGYNLKDASPPNGGLSLIRILAGSEGTLALTKQLTLRLLPQKVHRALVVVAYNDALAAVGDAERLLAADPTAVEFIDDRIIALARQDTVWSDINSLFPGEHAHAVWGLNFVEVQADDDAGLVEAIGRLQALSGPAPQEVLWEQVVEDERVISALWSLRSKCVGLLGRIDPTRQGTPFVEDAAVPPCNLRNFVEGFRAILDSHGLQYGMFGHADVGCIHVRPALDMRVAEDAAKIRPVSDAVAALARRNGGILWGEHGKGYRGAYAPEVLGPRIYAAMCRVKAVFDPFGLLNPGKIAAPDSTAPLIEIEGLSFRGTVDATITPEHLDGFEKAMRCNGNGQCFNLSRDEAMCPSYKATGDRRHSPKGRAALLREWLRMRAQGKEVSPFIEEVHTSLASCLSCKACASTCPVKVDIPDMRSRFLEQYYTTRRRPIRHHVLAGMESLAPLMRVAPKLANAAIALASPASRRLGLIDLPEVSTAGAGASMSKGGRRVLLLADSFLATFDGQVVDAAVRLLTRYGYRVTVSPVLPNGKALAVMGFRKRFERVAQSRHRRLARLVRNHEAVIEIEPAVHDMNGSEYARLGVRCENLTSLDLFLAEELASGRLEPAKLVNQSTWQFFSHCTEIATDLQVPRRWKDIFEAFGLGLQYIPTGCCGMAGFFGHEAANQSISRRLFDMTWKEPLESAGARSVATGFSCRCQAERFGGHRPRHPIEVLAEAT